MLDPIQWIQQLYQQQKDRDVNGVGAASWLTDVGKTEGVEFVPAAAGFDQSDKGINAILQAIAASTGNNEYFHNMQGNLISWLQTLNQRTYDRFLQLDERGYEERLRDEQRGYNSPSALVGRLMAAGMSREAALAAVQGSPSGGSASAIGASAPLQTGLPNNQANGDNSAQFANYASGAASLFTSLTNGISQLGSLGINASVAQSTNSLQAAQTEAQNMVNTAQKNSAALNGLIYKAQRQGLLPKNLSTFEDTLDKLGAITKEQSPEIFDFCENQLPELMSLPGTQQIASENYNTRFGNTNSWLQSELMTIQRRMNTIDLETAQSTLQEFMLNHEAFMKYQPYLNEVKYLQAVDDFKMLSEITSPEQFAYRLEHVCSHNASVAYAAMLDEIIQGGLLDSIKDSDGKRAILVSAAFLDRLDLTGEVGTGVRSVVYGSILNQEQEMFDGKLGKSQNEDSKPLDIFGIITQKHDSKTIGDVGSSVLQKAIDKFKKRMREIQSINDSPNVAGSVGTSW